MIENYNVLEGHDWVEYKGKLWISFSKKNGIGYLDLNSGKTTIIDRIPQSKMLADALVSKAILIGSKVIFAPHYTKYIPVVDCITEHVDYIEIDETKIKMNSTEQDGRLFWECISFGDKLYLWGIDTQSVAIVDIKQMSVEYLVFPFCKSVEAKKDVQYDVSYWGDGYFTNESDLYILCIHEGGIFRASKSMTETELIRIGGEKTCLFSMTEKDGWLWITRTDKPELILWNIDTREEKSIEICEKGIYWSPVVYDEYVYLFPFLTPGHIIRVNYKTFESEIFNDLDLLLNSNTGLTQAIGLKLCGDRIFFFRCSDYALCEYDFCTKASKVNKYEIEDEEFLNDCLKEYYSDLYTKFVNDKNVISENDYSLEEFIRIVCSAK